MPRYDFECSDGHVFEIDIPSSKVKDKFRCKSNGCNKLAERVWLSPRVSRQARAFSPSLLYVRADGEVIAPGRNDPSHLPKNYRNKLQKQGFQQVELQTYRQYESFCRQQSAKSKDKKELYLKDQQRQYDEVIKDQIEALRRGGEVEVPLENGQGSRTIKYPPLEQMDPRVRQLAEHAIAEAQGYRMKSEDSNVYIEAFEQDNAKWCDEDSGWKERR